MIKFCLLGLKCRESRALFMNYGKSAGVSFFMTNIMSACHVEQLEQLIIASHENFQCVLSFCNLSCFGAIALKIGAKMTDKHSCLWNNEEKKGSYGWNECRQCNSLLL